MSPQPPQRHLRSGGEEEEEETALDRAEAEEEFAGADSPPPRRLSEEPGESSSRSTRARSHDSGVRGSSCDGGGVWPEPFVEALAREVALEASRTRGALAAAPALVDVFKVCSTWRTISHSEILWESMTRLIWNRHGRRRSSPTWRDEYIRLHTTASNFRHNRANYSFIEYEVSSDSSNNGAACRCLALSSTYLAGGFFDGAVRIFSLRSKECISTMKPVHENRLGPLSRAIAGMILYDDKVVFASFDGSIFVGSISRGEVRCAHEGSVVNDGTLVDFTGCDKWWVGLYAGIPRHACHIWNAVTEEMVFNAGDITDPDALRGWHLLTEQAERIGRVRIGGGDDLLLMATRLKLSVIDLETHGIGFSVEEETADGIVVECVEVNKDRFLVAFDNGVAKIRNLTTLEDVCRFPVADGNDNNNGARNNHNLNNANRKLLGTLNTWQAFVCIDGVVDTWDADNGAHLYRLQEQIGDVFDLIADDEHVAACAVDTGIHLWSFGP